MANRTYKIKLDSDLMEAFKSSCEIHGIEDYRGVLQNMMDMFIYNTDMVLKEYDRIDKERNETKKQ